MLKGIMVMKHTDASPVPHLLPLDSCLGIEPRYLTIRLPALNAGSLFYILIFMMFSFFCFEQGIHEPNGPTQEYFQLERLVDMVVSPYLSNYLYMNPDDSSSGGQSFYALSLWVNDIMLFLCPGQLMYSEMF